MELVELQLVCIAVDPKNTRKNEGAVTHRVAAASACLNSSGQWSTVQIQVNGAAESKSAVGTEKPNGLVAGLERSYKRLEES